MKLEFLHNEKYRAMEWITAVVLAGVIIALHFINMQSAGALWRDEVHAVNLATPPNFADLLNTLEVDTHPLFTTLALRAWTATGGGAADADLRFFGLLVGLAVLGTLWFNARLFGHRLPVIGMVLLGLNPIVLRINDSIRPYGLGMLFGLLAFGLFWRVAIAPNARRVALAALAGVIMVHCSYQNAFLLLAVCLGAVALCLRKRRPRRAALIVGMGLMAALSMAPYVLIWDRVKDVVELNVISSGSRAGTAAAKAFGSPGAAMVWVWVLLTAVGVVTALVVQSRTRKGNQENAASKDLMLYALTVLAASTLIYSLFTRTLNFHMHPWHFTALIAVLAACLDTFLGHWKQGTLPRTALAIFALAIFGQAAWQGVHVRQTNLDLVAAWLEQTAQEHDLILVYPFWYGLTLHRYYHGKTPWASIPPLEDLSIHRYDLLRKKMTEANPVAPVLSKITKTLKAGNSIWIVGPLPRVSPGEALPAMPPAPHPKTGWYCPPYNAHWGRQASLVLANQAKERKILALSLNQAVNPHENVKIEFAHGMKNE